VRKWRLSPFIIFFLGLETCFIQSITSRLHTAGSRTKSTQALQITRPCIGLQDHKVISKVLPSLNLSLVLGFLFHAQFEALSKISQTGDQNHWTGDWITHNLGELKPCPVDVFGVGILSCGVLGFEVQVIVFRIQGSSCSA
jgi:hypothetical protein